MAITLDKIDQTNYTDYTFSPTLKRESIDFQPHDKLKSQQQIYNSNSIKDWEVTGLKGKKRFTGTEIKYYSNSKKVIEDKREWIEQHLDRRIQLFFQQAILCYNTPFIYDAKGAADQIGKGGTLKLNSKVKHKTQAAHSSTFPCLYASPKDQNGNADPTKRFVFLKYSHSYNQHNSTVELPIAVNQSDTNLDGKIGENKLRDSALKIINKVAKGEINPTKATFSFLKTLKKNIKDRLDHTQETSLSHDVFKIYYRHVLEVRKSLKDNSAIFDQIMGVKISDGNEKLREIVYKKRFNVIQQAEFIESQIAKRIFQAQKEILEDNTEKKIIDYRIRYILLEGKEDTEESRFFQKLFCTSLEQLESKLSNKPQDVRERKALEKIKTTKRKQIEDLQRDLRHFRRNLQKLELDFRSKLFRELRIDFKDWYQKDFVANFKVLHPAEKMSQSMVSRLEQPARLPRGNIMYRTPENQRKKELDVKMAQKVAATFNIDVGLFLPSLISSEY